MRTSQAARYARWSAILAGILLLIVSGVYLRRAWQSRQAEEQAPPAVPPSVTQRSAEFAFSNAEGDRTLFTVRASRATEFKKGDRSLLEDVWITVYGNSGQRFDNLHTQACDYIPLSGEIQCAGQVQIDLESASDARLHPSTPEHANPAARVMHIGTSRVSFNRETGIAASDQPVEFRFPQGMGQAVGIRYESARGQMRLLRAVRLVLHPRASSSATPDAAAAIQISGSALIYRRSEHVLHLLGPVEVHQKAGELRAGELDLELDGDLRARSIVARGHPEIREARSGTSLALSAEQISAPIPTDGEIRQITAAGNVRGSSKSKGSEERLEADRVEVDFPGRAARPGQLTAWGNVTASSARAAGGDWKLATQHLSAILTPDGGGGMRLGRAAAPSATVDWQSPAQTTGGTAVQQLQLKAQQLEAGFAGANQLRELRGTGGVQLRRQIGGTTPVIGTSRELIARFASGGWTEVEQSGEVRLQNGDRTAEASRATFDRASGSIILAGPVTLSDRLSRTSARSALFQQASHEFHAQGDVVTSEVSAGADGVTDFAAGPAHISADTLTVDTANGRAVYSGHARLWQGDAIIGADTLELDRPLQTLTATGHVRAVFPKAERVPPPGSGRMRAANLPDDMLRAEAGRMVYRNGDRRVLLDQGAIARMAAGSIHSDSMELFFAPEKAAAKQASGGSGKAAAPGTAESQELERAEAAGNVVIEQGDRRATAAHGEYIASEGKFVLSGGRPTITDSSGNATTGHQLTFFFGDDTIVVDSEEGSRTLTLHRVER
jgi:lipopolysaccharide export system protein LptA